MTKKEQKYDIATIIKLFEESSIYISKNLVYCSHPTSNHNQANKTPKFEAQTMPNLLGLSTKDFEFLGDHSVLITTVFSKMLGI